MEEWIYCGHSDLSLPTWYDEYVRADDNTIVKQVWNDGYEEIYCTEEDWKRKFPLKNFFKKKQKTFQKPIDKSAIIWYNKVYSVKGNHNNTTY